MHFIIIIFAGVYYYDCLLARQLYNSYWCVSESR